MAVKMVVFWCSLLFLIVGTNSEGEFDVILTPQSLSFIGSSRIPETFLREVFSAALGLSAEEGEWDGMTILDPFISPEAVVEIYVDGIPSLHESLGTKAHTFPLTADEYEPDTFEAIQHMIQRFGYVGSRLIKVKLSDVNQVSSGVFASTEVPKQLEIQLTYLKYSVEEDDAFLHELAGLKAITDKINAGVISGDNIIDFYNFRVLSLHILTDFHGPNSLQVKEAKNLLGEAIDALAAAFQRAYDGSVLVTCVATEVKHTRPAPLAARELGVNKIRRKRDDEEQSKDETSAMELKSDNDNTDDGSKNSGDYSEDYIAIFNIILWLGIMYALALGAIVYAIMDMDPGRDLVTYRMTSTRIKKNN